MISLSLNVITRMIAEKRFYGEEGKSGISEEARQYWKLVEEAGPAIGASTLADFLTVLRWVDYKGFNKKLARFQKGRDELMQRLIDEHRSKSKEEGVQKP